MLHTNLQKFLAFLTFAIFAAVAVLGSEEGLKPKAEYPSLSHDGTTLVFVSNSGGSRDLWVSDANGGNARPLTPWPTTDEKQPDWSPDGTHIVFSSNRGSTRHNIWVINSDGSNPTQLTSDNAEHEQPRYSPDGSSILYIANSTGKKELWKMNADGSGQQLIVLLGLHVSDPAWSPSGGQVVYVGCTGGVACNLFSINADGSGGSQLTSGNFQDWTPDWGASGIIFASNRGGAQGLWLVQPDGSGLQQLTAPDGTADLDPRWTGAGNGFVFSRSGNSSADAASDIWSSASLGATAQRLTKLGVDTTPPVITPAVVGTLGNNGWYTTGVRVTWQVVDPETGVADTDGCAPSVLSVDTPGVTLTCTARNGAGLFASFPLTLKIGTVPAITSTNNAMFTFGTPGSYTVTASGFPTPTLIATGTPNGVTFVDSGNGTATLSETSAVAGTYSIIISASNVVGSPATQSLTLTVNPVTTATSVSPGTVKYSDYASFSATVTPASAGGQTLNGNVQFYLNGSTVGSPVAINTSGVATLSQVQVNLSPNSYPAKAVFSSTNSNFAGSSGSANETVTQKNAFVLYSGDTIAQVGSLLTLRATVWDSAAVGYPGTNPETGPTAAIGDVTKMWIAFDVYPAGSCGGGTPSTLYAQVALTSTPGVGAATGTLSSNSEVTYCVVPRLVAGSSGGANLFYAAGDAQLVGVDFYVNSGQFATGGGWVIDTTGSHGNFGFNARYNSAGSPKGQMVYVYRSSYNGVLADFIIKSNALNALQFSGTTYPISSTLQGKANVQINRASDGYTLFSAGNYTFSATVTDSGQNGFSGKQFSLIVYDTSGVPYHSVLAGTPLQGGNAVVHSH